jgi:hypothetical protein
MACFRRCDPCSRKRKLQDYDKAVREAAGKRANDKSADDLVFLKALLFGNLWPSALEAATKGNAPAAITSNASNVYKFMTSKRSKGSRSLELYRGVAGSLLPDFRNPDSIGNHFHRVIDNIDMYLNALNGKGGLAGLKRTQYLMRIQKTHEALKQKIKNKKCYARGKLVPYEEK